MFKNEYYSNSYRVIITNKLFHFIVSLIEYMITITIQITLLTIKFDFGLNETLPSNFFYVIFIQYINKLPEYSKYLIIIIIFILIYIYFFVYNKFAFKNITIINIITINFMEIILFRLFFIIILHILLSIKGIAFYILIIISIPVIVLIINNFILNHLYYFSPHFMIYPFDCYSSINDVFHIVEKIAISISLQSSSISLNKFFYIFTLILQISNCLYSIYIFYYKSYYIMSNIFLDKTRFSLITTSVFGNIVLIALGNKNYLINTFLILSINIFTVIFLIVQIFFDPYSTAYFVTDEKIDNLYFYYYIIDHLKNDSFLLEEKIRSHYMKCQKCNLCKNIKGYLKHKNCYKNIYKILYNKVGVLGHTFSEIIHTVLINGKEALKYNSFYLINIMYCYYVNINQKNYVLGVNLKLLFEIVNEENKNVLENHLLSTEQILLINEFLLKSDNILNKIKTVLTEDIGEEKVSQFFDLYDLLFELNTKKFKNKLYYNKNEGIINFYKYISICSMIYEEIFNVSLSNGGISLKENQIFLDDISNKNNTSLNQIIIQLDLLSFENKIIYITGELAKYKDKDLCQLFPNLFKTQQFILIKNKIMNSNFLRYINKDKDFNQNNRSKEKNDEDNYICLQLLIYDEIAQKKIFVMITLKLNLIYPLDVTKKILLTGLYVVNKNIIITLDKSTKENKKECVLNFDENQIKNVSNNGNNIEERLIKYKKNDKYYNGKKLFFITKLYVNPNCYNIYSLFRSERQRSYKMEKEKGENQTNNKYELESKKNIYAGVESTTQNFNFYMMSSTSTFNSMVTDTQNFKKREKGKKENKKKSYIKYYQITIFIFALFIFLIQIIFHISLNSSLIHMDNQNGVLTMLKNYYGLFNNMLTSTLLLSCIADKPRGDKCQSFIYFFDEKIVHGLNLTQFLFFENYGTCFQISAVRQRIQRILSESNDKTLDSLVYDEMMNFIISQKNKTGEEIKLIANRQINSFIDLLNLMTTGIIILNSNIDNLNNTVYIINKVNIYENWDTTEEPFQNVKVIEQFTEYQYYFYFIILNYQQFMDRLDIISNKLVIITNRTVNNNINHIRIIISVTLVGYIILQIMIYFYIHYYYKMIAKLLNNIEKKMQLKNDEISVREMFLQKIEKLKIIISLYKQDIYQAIVDLNFIYDNYKKFIQEKNKEMLKYLKKERFSSDKNYKSEDKSIGIIKKYISTIKVNQINLYLIILCSLISIIITIGLFLLWNTYESFYLNVSDLVKSHGSLSGNANKFINYYLLMIFNSITLEDINKYEKFDLSKDEGLFPKLYRDLEVLYESKKYMKNLEPYNINDINTYFNFTCQSFYEQLYQTNQYLLQPQNMRVKGFLINICLQNSVFKSNNYIEIFTILFEMIQLGMNQINDHSYEGLINYLYNPHFIKTTTVYLFVYFYTFEILGLKVQRQSYEKMSRLIGEYLLVSFIIYYIASLIFIVIILCIFIFKFNKNFRRLEEMKKVFKIYDERE